MLGRATGTEEPAVLAPILDSAQRAHFEREGYLVVPGLIEERAVEAVREAIQWFLELDPTFVGPSAVSAARVRAQVRELDRQLPLGDEP